MFAVSAKQVEDQLIIRWQLSKYELPLAQITSVTLDDTYGGSEPSAIRIGPVGGTTERILIRTTNQSYILFTNSVSLISQIQAMLSHSAN
ncbi:SunI/YnzG family protein [Paenibacillus amylolyticus]|uniref:SunI/YnzG family protein n=1 Tax=Paenibacillus amylolyticus TaxID=1451 RepID=UPI003EB6FD9E